MKNKFKLVVISVLASLIVSCGKSDSSDINTSSSLDFSTTTSSEPSSSFTTIESESSSSSSSLDVSEIVNDDYYWMFNQDNAYSDTLDFSITSSLLSSMSLRIDNSEVKALPTPNFDTTIYYDAIGCNSDNANRAADYYYLNGVRMAKLPSDGSKGIPLSYENLLIGENVFSVNIGAYWGQPEYDKSKPHTSVCDDFQLANMRMVLSSGLVVKPTKMVFYKPIQLGKVGYNTYTLTQQDDTYYWIGDGWAGSESYDGNPNPRLDIPFQIDYYFEYDIPESIATYNIDTSKYADGSHLISLYDGDSLVKQNSVYFDNGAPNINVNIQDNQYINSSYNLTYNINDSVTGVLESIVCVDGKQISNNPISLTEYSSGRHCLSIYAIDKAGNFKYDVTNFTLDNRFDTMLVDASLSSSSLSYNVTNPNDNNFDMKVYQANMLQYSSNHSLNEQISSTLNPYQTFDVTVSDVNSDLYISYSGSSAINEKIELSIWNVSKLEYERIGIINSGETISLNVSVKDRIESNVAKFKAQTLYVGNGSNMIYWSSDTQYLPKTKFTDINYMYNSLMTFVSEQYNANNIAYMAQTGDIVDNAPELKQEAINEWENATKAFEILDNNKVPYGVVAGNHDVGTDIHAVDYTYYSQYFGLDRFNNNDWYGGNLNDNESHYDLISVGKFDFIILYLGYGLEYRDETITWANDVLAMYPHRNAIIATHAYLAADGSYDPATSAQVIFDEIVTPNENVKMVFCGHTDGNASVKRQVNDSRYIYELLNCYQFVEKETYTISHLINGYKCNGEAYIRSMEFKDDGTIDCKTFSPITKGVNPLGSNDSYSIHVELQTSNKVLTSNEFKAAQVGNIIYQNNYNLNQISDSLSCEYQNVIVYAKDSNNQYNFKII